MRVSQHTDILAGLPGDSTVCDSTSAAGYAQITAAADEVAGFLAEAGKDRVQCLHLPVKNDVGHVILLLALLRSQVNFFVFSPNAAVSAGVPAFCDKLLKVENGFGVHNVSGYLTLADNPGYHGPESDLKPGSGAVLFSSSGTTGSPKFIRYHAGQLVANARKCVQRFHLDERHKVLVPVPVSHMYGFGVGLLPALIAGASLCLVEKNNVVKLYDKLTKFRPDVTLLTPTVCQMLLLLNKDIPGNGCYISAGDRIRRETHLAFEAKYGKLINLYGCTEMGAIATSDPEAGAEERAAGVVKPLAGVDCRIVPPGKGEITCRHDAGFECYVDPHGRRVTPPGGEPLWYRTRDVGSAEGPDTFRVAGRVDGCINRNGFLVPVQEIEAALEDVLTGISQVVVLAADRETIRGKSLVAVSELKKDHQLNAATAKTLCKEKMPSHLVPDEFHFTPALPRLGNGKPDRRLLASRYTPHESPIIQP